MEAGSESRLRSTLGVFGTAFRNRSLLLVELAWLAFNSAEWGVWLALTVWAYTNGGAAAVSLIIIVQLVPAIFISPYLGAITDRARAGRVLFIGLLIMGASMAGLAVAMALDAPPVLIYVLAPIMNLALSVPRPAQAALLPGVVRTPLELTAANVVSSWMENASVLLAPALTGVLLGVGGPALAAGALAVCTLAGAFLVVGIPGPRPMAEREQGVSLTAEVRSSVAAVWRVPARAHPGRRGRLAVHPRRRTRRALRRPRDHHPGHGRVRRRLPERGLRRRRGHRRRRRRQRSSRGGASRRRSSPASSRRRSPSGCSASSPPWPAPSCCSPSPA